MSGDLVKQLRGHICAQIEAELMGEAADRIEELEEMNKGLCEESAFNNDMVDSGIDKILELEDKLAKAVGALEYYADSDCAILIELKGETNGR